MNTIKCVKEYQMVGYKIPPGTILIEIKSKIGRSTYKDKNKNLYHFDNSEILFSPLFQESFILL